MSYSREYAIWANMKDRCANPRHRVFKDYGGRGITFCDQWKSFKNFYQDMGPRPPGRYTLERKNNNGNYGPDNCIWATYIQQERNKRTTRRVTLNGTTLSMAEWVERLKSNRNVVDARLRKGWSERAALMTPCVPGKQMRRVCA